ncbi:unnamed protein product [Blepharisma stoltei]|uniref:USP domain-containing protein n=1 Tax=Blepharisma stoltei TaxID=1481888 RepID=A0AAU9IR81_9CILI|nr:unnamed protein product [Blepharisma stoltei]
MPTRKGSLSWASKAAISIIECNKDRLCIDPNSPIGKLLADFESSLEFLPFREEKFVVNILEYISKNYDPKYFETVQDSNINVKYLKKKDEETYFFEQIKAKEAPLVLLKRHSEDKPYAYFERNNGTVYLLTALFTQNVLKRLYCNFGNQWKNLSENPDDKTPIKFREETVYIYTKINKEDLDKEKVDKILPSEWEGHIKENLRESITIYSVSTNQNQAGIKIPKDIEAQQELKQKIQNKNDEIQNYKDQLEKSKIENEKLKETIKSLSGEKEKNIEIRQGLINENEKLRDLIENLNVKINEKNADISKELQKSNSAQQELSKNIQNKEQMIEYYKNQLSCLENANEKLQKELKIINDELKEKNIKIDSQNQEILNRDDIIKNYKEQFEELTNERNKYQKEIKELKIELQKAVDENINLSAINAILQKEAETEAQSLIQVKEIYKTQNEALVQERENLQPQLKALSEETKEFKSISLPPRIIRRPIIYDGKKSGIPNIGNTCYLNSLLQLLASNNEFYDKIQPIEHELFSSLSSLLKSIRNPGSYNNTDQLVRSFKYQLGAEFPMLGNSSQQDSKEVMVMLTGILSELTNIDSIFTTIYKQIFKCHACGNKANRDDTNIFITVPRGKSRSIQEFLPILKQPKYYTGSNQLFCENCQNMQNITMECEEIIWPSTVTFYLPSNNGSTKINEELNIEGTTYRWYGLICHYGNSQFGHYKAYTWDTKNWTEYNDFSAKIDKVDVANGYLAFYARAES